MKIKVTKPFPSRRAFTLVELIVVLMILVGLAAVLIPVVSGLVALTSRSSSASNIGNVAAAIQRYEAYFMSYPDKMDSLMTDLTGTDLNTLPSALTSASQDVTLTANTLAALNAAGVTKVGVHAVSDATFNLATSTTLTNTTVLKGPTAATQVSLGLETTGTAGKYVMLGIGGLCDANGKTMLDAPVHFPRNGTTNPNTTYSRFLAVFQITDGTNALSRAKLAAVIAPDGSGLAGELDGYFKASTND